MWEKKTCGQRKIEGEADGRGIYFVPITLTFGHYGLAGIRLTALVLYITRAIDYERLSPVLESLMVDCLNKSRG